MSTSVYYFGGYNASPDDVDSWVRSARLQKPDVTFIPYPWKSGPASYPAETVVKGSQKSGQFKEAVDAIDACTATKIYIVGHSSGCAVANAVDKAIKSVDNVSLVALDGFSPNEKQLERKTTQVWGAVCGKVRSKNYPGESKGRRRIYEATNCYDKWSLHFSVVNANAVDGKVHSVQTGYYNCKANLAWLLP